MLVIMPLKNALLLFVLFSTSDGYLTLHVERLAAVCPPQ
jgi:hypothetical protein